MTKTVQMSFPRVVLDLNYTLYKRCMYVKSERV